MGLGNILGSIAGGLGGGLMAGHGGGLGALLQKLLGHGGPQGAMPQAPVEGPMGDIGAGLEDALRRNAALQQQAQQSGPFGHPFGQGPLGKFLGGIF